MSRFPISALRLLAPGRRLSAPLARLSALSSSLSAPLARALLPALSAFTLALTLLPNPARAFNFTGVVWPDGTIPMHLQLDATPSGLLDGATDWADIAESALNDWNAHLARAKFTVVRNSTATRARGNRTNNVFFSSTIYGTAFDSRTLAVTLGSSSTTTLAPTERDVIFNTARTWNSYRGALRGGITEFRRVALHEFGHVLGLDHPDEAEPAQNVAAVMDSIVSSVETLRADDIAGARALYDQTATHRPLVGTPFTLAVSPAGTGPFTYTWHFRPTGTALVEEFRLPSSGSYTIGSVELSDAGTYVATATAPSGAFFSQTAVVEPVAVATDSRTRLANLSTRGHVGIGGEVMIVGFNVSGPSAKTLLIRAAGPALGDLGVGTPLPDPLLTLNNAAGTAIGANDNWDASVDAAALSAASARLGAFAFKPGSRDSALLVTLPPGSYTAVVSGIAATVGNALIEVYDADPDAATSGSRRLVNLSTRGTVGTGDDALIAGLVVAGPAPRTFLIRAVGPTLTRAPFNLSGALLDPFLQLFRDQTLLRENDDLDAPLTGVPALRAAGDRVGAFRLLESRITALRSGLDSVMLVTLAPGAYTAKVTGFEGATGIALIEIYEMP